MAKRPTFSMDQVIEEQDTPWKEVIEGLFPRFMEFFFPDAFADIDWGRHYVFLEKELQQVMRGAATGRRFVDKLVRVWRVGGQQAWVLIHIEVQGQKESEFPKRMFVYNNRLFDRYGRLVVSFAVLTDDHLNWRPSEYRQGLWGTESALKFRVVKLLDYLEDWTDLEKSRNPFAVVVMAHLKGRATRTDPAERLRWKVTLAKMLYRKGYKRHEVIGLFRFMDYLLALPEDFEKQYEEEMIEYEEAEKIPYLSRIERRALERGLQKGLEQGLEQGLEKGLEKGLKKGLKRGLEQGLEQGLERGLEQGLERGQLSSACSSILVVLETRFHKVPVKIKTQLKKVTDQERLAELLRKAVVVASVTEFQRELAG